MKKRPPRGMTGIEVLVLLAIIMVMLTLLFNNVPYFDLVQMWGILAWLTGCLLVIGRKGANWARSILFGIIFLVAVFVVLETASCLIGLFPMCARVESKKFNSAPSYEVLSHLAQRSTGLSRRFEVYDKDFANATMTWEVRGAEDLGENLDRLCKTMGVTYDWHWTQDCGNAPRPSSIFIEIYKARQGKLKASRSGDQHLRVSRNDVLFGADMAMPVLLRALKDTDPIIRLSAVNALGWKGKELIEALPELVEALKDKNNGVQTSAVFLLGEIGSDAKAAAPMLRERLGDPSAWMRLGAAYALWKVTGESEEAFAVLFELLHSAEGAYKISAVRYLGEMGPEAKAAVPALKQLEESVPGREFEFREELDKALQRIQE